MRKTKPTKKAKRDGLPYRPEEFYNGDTARQLLARSRYALYKSPVKWTNNQRLRMNILFEQYPQLRQAYDHVREFNAIYSKPLTRNEALRQFSEWMTRSRKHKTPGFKRMANTIEKHFEHILNYFENRSTNASAESFNAKIKGFRAMQRGVSDTNFFLFRLSKIYA